MMIQAELKNEGTQPVLVCRDLSVRVDNSQPCAWQFAVLAANTSNQRPGCATAADGLPPTTENFASLLIKNWILLSPGYSYRVRIDVASAFCSGAPPGRYQVVGFLTSSGINSQSINYELGGFPREIKSVPYRSWAGTVSSNKIWITIGPPGKESR